MSNLSQEIINAKIAKLSPFNELSAPALQEALKYCEVFNAPARKKLFKRGEQDDNSYYLLTGTVNLIDENFNSFIYESDDPRCLNPLDNNATHQFSAITTEDSHVLKVNKMQLDLAMTWESANLEVSLDATDGGSDWMSALLDSDVFAKVPPTNIQQLFSSFETLEFSAGTTVIKENDVGDSFFVIQEGQAEVSAQSEQGEQVLAHLKPGQFFGEEALIGETTRNATVTMKTDGKLMRLDKDTFKQLLEQPVLNSLTEKDLEAIVADGTKLCLLDVRLTGEYRHSHRENSVNIPLNRLRARLPQLSTGTIYVIPNNAGPRSELGVYLLVKAGLQAYLLKE